MRCLGCSGKLAAHSIAEASANASLKKMSPYRTSVLVMGATCATSKSGDQKASPIPEASVNRVKSASSLVHAQVFSSRTPGHRPMHSMNQFRSTITCLFKQIGARANVLPLIFAYDDWSAGRNNGYAFKAQLQYPSNHCQSRSG